MKMKLKDTYHLSTPKRIDRYHTNTIKKSVCIKYMCKKKLCIKKYAFIDYVLINKYKMHLKWGNFFFPGHVEHGLKHIFQIYK